MPLRAPSAALLAASVVLAHGCAQWPRWSHVPDQDGAVEAPDDPRELVDREWDVITEETDLPDGSVGVAATPLDLERGKVIAGALDGLGWNDLAPAAAQVAPGCNEVGAPRHPEAIPGEWTGDVDVVVVAAADGGRLCAELATDSAEAGWDLLLARLDACGVPESFAQGDDGPLGWARGGTAGGWAAPLEPGVAYAVTLASYWPTLPDGEVRYRLSLSLLAADDEAGLCPLPPAEEP